MHRRKVIWTQRARDRLEPAAGYIAESSPEQAEKLTERALEAADSFKTSAGRGPRVPELADPTLREILVSKFRLVYQMKRFQVSGLAFLQGALDFNRWWPGS